LSGVLAQKIIDLPSRRVPFSSYVHESRDKMRGNGVCSLTKPNKLVISLSVDACAAILAAVFMQLVHLNTPTLVVIWIILIGVVANFIWVVPFSRIGHPSRSLIIIAVCGFLSYAAYDSVQEKIKTEDVRNEAEGARVDIESVQFVDAGKSPDVPYAFVNFYYKNNGHLTAQGSRRRFGVFTDDHVLTEKEIDSLFATLENDQYVFNKNDQIQSGNGGHFSEPHNYDDEQKAIEQAIPSVKNGKTILYVLVVYKYRDYLMASNNVRVSEFSSFFDKELAVTHFCRQNNTHMETFR
jgi:hypothetical protein